MLLMVFPEGVDITICIDTKNYDTRMQVHSIAIRQVHNLLEKGLKSHAL